ncbi:MAG TPA: hypothetical protein VGK23_11785 [Methanomassiliicoccales archaeon]|jgi:hypothetical protein
MANDDMIRNVEDMRKLFEILTEQVPRLMESMTKVLYGAQEGERFGQSVAAFYKSLRAAGMTNQESFELTKEYMSTLSLGGLLKMIVGSQGGKEGAIGEKFRHEMEECEK